MVSFVTSGKYHGSASNLAMTSLYISIPKYAVNCSFYHAPRCAVTTELRAASIKHYKKTQKSKILCVKTYKSSKRENHIVERLWKISGS